MVKTIIFDPLFKNKLKKIKDSSLKSKIKKQIAKIINSPETGKPMKYARKGTREVYVRPFRLSYHYSERKDELIFLELYHKDKQ